MNLKLMFLKIATFVLFPLKTSFWREELCFANPVLHLLESVRTISCRSAFSCFGSGSKNGGIAPPVRKHRSISKGLWMGSVPRLWYSGRKWRHTIHLYLCQSLYDRWSLVQHGFSCNPACPSVHLDTQADGVFVCVPPCVTHQAEIFNSSPECLTSKRWSSWESALPLSPDICLYNENVITWPYINCMKTRSLGTKLKCDTVVYLMWKSSCGWRRHRRQ